MHRSIRDAGWSRFAGFWDGLHGDRTDEVRFWAGLARPYGTRVLAPLAATGEVAVALSREGFDVVAVDCCAEMLDIARGKAADVPGFRCRQGNLADLTAEEGEFDFLFLTGGNYHHFWDEMGQLTALDAVHRLLRPGGGFGLEMMPFDAERPSHEADHRRSSDPARGESLSVKSESHYEARTRLLSIQQTLTIAKGDASEEHRFTIPLRMFTRVELMASLAQTGFRRVAEFGSYSGKPHTPASEKWIVLAERRAGS